MVFLPFIVIAFLSCKKDELKPSDKLYIFSEGTIGFFLNPPTLVDNCIYIGTSRGDNKITSDHNAFFKFDSTLKEIWSYPLGKKEVRGAASLDSFGNVYFVVGEGIKLSPDGYFIKLYSLDKNGFFRWSKDLIGNPFVFHGMSNPAVSADNQIYIGGNGIFYAFDINGKEIWKYTGCAQTILSAPVIDDEGNIYFTAMNEVISLDRLGAERWHFNSNEDIESYPDGSGLSSPAFSTDYSRLIVPQWKTIYCLGTDNGEIVWKYRVPWMVGDFRATPAVDDHDNIYIGNHGIGDKTQSLFAIKSDGTGMLWYTKIGADLYSSPALGDDKVIYVGSEFSGDEGYTFHAIDMLTGEIIWSTVQRSDVTFSSPVISNSGIVYVGTMGNENGPGELIAFHSSSHGLLPNAGSPRFHGSNSSSGRKE
jgi:outer membrane protein assembly factor BamB